MQAQEVEQALQQQGAAAEKAVCELRRSGFAKKHLSKDGTPEHVYFPRMPYIADGNPNTYAFVASPETAVGYAFTGRLTAHPAFSPEYSCRQPQGEALPPRGYDEEGEGVRAVKPAYDTDRKSVV